MSFEMVFVCFKEGQQVGLSRQDMLKAFGSFVREDEPDVWVVEYADDEMCEVYVTPTDEDADSIKEFMVARPCVDPRLWDALFAIMRLGNVMLLYPGATAAVVASEQTMEHLPPDVMEMGDPVRVASGKELRDYVNAE
jgi:hypothetical protein